MVHTTLSVALDGAPAERLGTRRALPAGAGCTRPARRYCRSCGYRYSVHASCKRYARRTRPMESARGGVAVTVTSVAATTTTQVSLQVTGFAQTYIHTASEHRVSLPGASRRKVRVTAHPRDSAACGTHFAGLAGRVSEPRDCGLGFGDAARLSGEPAVTETGLSPLAADGCGEPFRRAAASSRALANTTAIGLLKVLYCSSMAATQRKPRSMGKNRHENTHKTRQDAHTVGVARPCSKQQDKLPPSVAHR